MIHYWKGDDQQAAEWMNEAINVKGSTFQFADEFLSHLQPNVDLSQLSLKQANDYRYKALDEEQKLLLRNKLIVWRILSFFILNILAFFTVGVVVGLIGWFLIMYLLVDKYLVKWGLDSLQ